MNLERERELFEKHVGKFFRTNEAFETKDNKYIYDEVVMMWDCWLASASREGYRLVPVEPTGEQWIGLARQLGRYMQMHDRYCPKTLKKYLDRFHRNIPEWLNKEVGNWESDHAFATADLPVFIYKAMLGAVE